MTSTETYFLSLTFIIVCAVAFGFVLGKPYWFSKGVIDGLERGGQIWSGQADDEEAE